MAGPKALESSLNKLSIKPQASKPKKKPAVTESWEDEELSPNSSSDEKEASLGQAPSASYPAAPPPTPISPSASFPRDTFVNPYGYTTEAISDSKSERRDERRPDKTDAVARRLIAGALGVKAPRRTEEQKAYDKALKEKEIKRRNAEKAEVVRKREEAERARAAVWSD